MIAEFIFFVVLAIGLFALYLFSCLIVSIYRVLKRLNKIYSWIFALVILSLFVSGFYLSLRFFSPFPPVIDKRIDLTDVGCRSGQSDGYYVSIKNLDSKKIITISSDLTARIDYNVAPITGCSSSIIAANGIVNCNITATGGSAGSFHKVRITGPANSAEEPAIC
jgi:energy-coupling factor transporter transmembrane protein EcfT